MDSIALVVEVKRCWDTLHGMIVRYLEYQTAVVRLIRLVSCALSSTGKYCWSYDYHGFHGNKYL